jgi:hypothetical protein
MNHFLNGVDTIANNLHTALVLLLIESLELAFNLTIIKGANDGLRTGCLVT